MAALTKESIYSFRDLDDYHHSGKHGSVKADMKVGKELRVLYLNLQATWSDLSSTLYIAEACKTLKPAFTVKHLH